MWTSRPLALLALLGAARAFAAEPACPPAAKDAASLLGPCEKKSPQACVEAGDKLADLGGCRAEAAQRYEQACKGGLLKGCSKQAFRLIERSRDPKVVKQAISLFTKACDGGDALGCSNLASFAWDGEGMPRDVKKAAAYAEKGCAGGDAFACGTLGSLWWQGELGKKDDPKAVGLFEKACAGGSATGCNLAGIAYFEGRGAKKDVEKALSTWNGACRERNGAACSNLGRALRAKNDHARAEKAFARACKLGDEEGCKERDAPPELEE